MFQKIINYLQDRIFIKIVLFVLSVFVLIMSWLIFDEYSFANTYVDGVDWERASELPRWSQDPISNKQCGENGIIVSCLIQSVVCKDAKAICSIHLTVADTILRNIFVGIKKESIVDIDRGFVKLKEKYASAKVILNFSDIFHVKYCKIEVPLTSVRESNDTSKGVVCEFPLFGFASSYPSDKYLMSEYVSISLPNNMFYLDTLNHSLVYTPPFSFEIAKIMNNNNTILLYDSVMAKGEAHFINAKVDRSFFVKMYVYIMISSIYLLLLVITIFYHRNPKAIDFGTMLFGLAAFVLTILPLRSIIIPDEIGGLTRVDYWLSLLIVLTILLMAYRSYRLLGNENMGGK